MFTLVDFSVPTRDHPMSHAPAQPPLCDDCRSLDLCFFNPLCPGCQDILLDSKTTIPELFAVMRQWVPQTQRNLSSLTREVLRRGANVNDKDGLTDLSLLHYASKAGAAGVGNSSSAANLVQSLINKGADAALRCRWTDMNAMHYAVYFDAAKTVRVFAEKNQSLVMSTCSELSNGTCLHLAATNLSIEAGKVLLQYGADGSVKDNDGKLPFEVIPDNLSSEQVNICKEFIDLLKNAAENPPPKSAKSSSGGKSSPLHVPAPLILPRVHDTPQNINLSSSQHKVSGSSVPKSPAPSNTSTISTTSTAHTTATSSSSPHGHSPSPMQSEVTMATLVMKVGDRILIDASSSKPKRGTIRFGGTTEFHPGQWAGIELDDAIGKNDGSYGGIRYFTCKPKYGLFVPMHRISKDSSDPQLTEKKKKKKLERGRDSMLATSMAIEAQSHLRMNNEIEVGERVTMSGNRPGVLRYAGTVKFAPGFWMGVELDTPTGKNDGSMNGVRYFKCRPRHGIFVLQSKVKRNFDPHHLAPRAAPPSSHTPVSSGTDSVDFSSRSVSLTTSGGASGASEAEMSSPSPHPSPATSRKKLVVNSNNNNSRSPSGTVSKHSNRSGSSVASGRSTGSNTNTKPSPDVVLGVGMSVFVNKEMGVVRYIGKTEFDDGVWIGVELRKPMGKNDGSVKGKRYFTCKPNYGLFVKPEKATHRGIRCSKILPNKL